MFPFGFYFTPYALPVFVAVLFAVWAQFKVKSTYARYAEMDTRSGLTGADVAQRILEDAGVPLSSNPESYPGGVACGLQAIPGNLTDHYDPRTRVLSLSEEVYHGRSISALGIAAHEVGHAIQHARLYTPLMARNVVYPICNIGSGLAWPLFFIGLLMRFPPLLHIGIALFTFAVFFTVLTLPVEFNASRRAVHALANGGYLTQDELKGAKAVLTAAAMTYVAAMLVAVLQLLRLVMLARRN